MRVTVDHVNFSDGLECVYVKYKTRDTAFYATHPIPWMQHYFLHRR